MRKILFSVNPTYVKSIFAGTKIYEFRKRRCKNDVTSILIYATAPIMRVVGEAGIEAILEGSVQDIWEKTKDFGGVSFEFFKKYYGRSDKAVAYKLTNVRQFDKSRELSEYGVCRAPQSFMYVAEDFCKNDPV